MAKQFITGSIKLTEITEAFKNGHSAFWKSQKGANYANIKIFIDDTPDKFGNTVSIQLNAKKDTNEKTVYIGEGKVMGAKTTAQPQTAPFGVPETANDDLPF